MPKEKTKISISLSRHVKYLLVGLLVGVAIGIGSVLVFQAGAASSETEEEASSRSVSVVFDRIVNQNELVSVSQDYSIVEKAEDENRLFDIIKIPFTENSFWYRYAGTIKAGVNLETAELSTSVKTINITPPSPYVISNTPNMDATGVLEENNNFFNPIDVKDVDALQADCRTRSEDEAIAGGLLEEARTEAEANIRNLFFAALGESYEVNFQWKDAA